MDQAGAAFDYDRGLRALSRRARQAYYADSSDKLRLQTPDYRLMSPNGTELPCRRRRPMSEVDAVDGSSTGT